MHIFPLKFLSIRRHLGYISSKVFDDTQAFKHTGCNRHVYRAWRLSGDQIKKLFEPIRNPLTICFLCFLLHWHQFGAVQVEGANATAGIFVTFPGPGISNFNGAVDQVSSAHPSSSNHILLLFFLLILFLIARWLEPPCFFLPSVRSTTRQTLRFLRGGSNRTIFFPYIDNFDSGGIRVLHQLGHLFATLFFFPLSLGPLLVGLVVVNIGICFGHNAG